MKYLSVCSGIEAATSAWHGLGWEPVAFSEIEAFPSAVLKRHYPDVPNLGDMTKFEEWNLDSIDLLVGGTPCQSFSVAGLRKGLDDPRGNLMLTYGAIAKRFSPKWLVWENVPGVLSSNDGKDFASFLDMLEELGYIVDCDILDAQFHGVAQRRRRVFVCAQSSGSLIQEKTTSSALTIAQCWLEILHGILVDQSLALENAPLNLGYQYLSRDGVQRRMKLFGMLGENSSFPKLQENLIEAFRKSQAEQKNLDVSLGESARERTQEDLWKDSKKAALSTLTEQLLSECLEESYEVMRSFITSTATNSITLKQIYSCSKAVLSTGRLIQVLNQSSPVWWSAASSYLIALKEYTNYARSTSSSLFGDLERVQAWGDFIQQAEHSEVAFGNTGIECFGSVFPVPSSLSGHPAPSREPRQGTARGATQSVANCLTSRMHKGMNSTLDEGQTPILEPVGVPEVMSTLLSSTAGVSRPGNTNTEHETYIPMAYSVREDAVADNFSATELEVSTAVTSLRPSPQSHHAQVFVAQPMTVRRLTPRECERLQGFPDDHTLIPWRGKEAPDGPRYKSLGNSMAVPVMAWIGKRIGEVNELQK